MEYVVLQHATVTASEASAGPDDAAAFVDTVTRGGGTVLDHLPLMPPRTARTLRWQDDDVVEVDGPADLAPQPLTGVFVILASDLDQAIEWCSGLAGTVEIRPVVTDDEPSGPTEPRPAPEGCRAVALLHGDEDVWRNADDRTRDEVYARFGRWASEVDHAGARLWGGHELTDSTSATTLRRPGTDTRITDGPFAETVEQLSGYFLLDAPSLDAVVGLMHGLPGGIVEVRAVAVQT